MDMEEIENMLEERKTIQESLGFMNLEHYKEFKSLAANGLIMFGDIFSQKLGFALENANKKDSVKIMRYWNYECEHHGLMYKMYLEKEKHRQQQE